MRQRQFYWIFTFAEFQGVQKVECQTQEKLCQSQDSHQHRKDVKEDVISTTQQNTASNITTKKNQHISVLCLLIVL